MAGSKPKFSADDMVRVLLEERGLVASAANKLRCDPKTIYNYAKRYPSVQAAMDDGRVAMLDLTEAALAKQIMSGDTTAIIFYLKTQGKRRGYIERTENVNLNVDTALLKQAIDAIEQAGLNASDVFNDLIAQAAQLKQGAGAAGADDSADGAD